ncbi:MAG: UDP-N-acetylglucosamine 1-carboxyvinyltransferase [Clostridia bacterium]|nr:UDP-N-acetylglucosamine 1-carboxyvinyltransferase [Clostridia bacterium]
MAYLIEGKEALFGEITAQGSKNAALPILFAALAVQGRVLLTNVPDITDIRRAKAIVREMGVTVYEEGNTLLLDATNATPVIEREEDVRAMRASSYLLGVCLGRFGRVSLAYPGGCDLGARPLNYHKQALEALGASWEEADGYIHLEAQSLRGGKIVLPYPSVGATVNALLAALFARGETYIVGGAKEEHIEELLRFLRRAGADITCKSGVLRVRGQKKLHACRFSVMPDEIEAGTYLIGAAASGGKVRVSGIAERTLFPLLSCFSQMGIAVKKEKNAITVFGSKNYRGVSLVCAPFPAFPTDLHPQMSVLMLGAKTESHIVDTVWKDRFGYTGELSKMGASLERKENGVFLYPSALHGARLSAPDLRAGAALAIAAFCAEGKSVLENTEYIERGYESFVLKWQTLGGRISYINA